MVQADHHQVEVHMVVHQVGHLEVQAEVRMVVHQVGHLEVQVEVHLGHQVEEDKNI